MATDSQHRSLAPSFFAQQLEKAINQALAYAPGTRAALTPHEGKTVTLHANRPKVQLTLEIGPEDIRIYHYWEGKPTVSIRGPLISILFQLGLDKSPGELVASGVRVEGDHAFAQKLSSIFRDNDIDLEEPLSQWVGDVTAHQMGQAARSAFGWLKKTASALMDDSSHYLREESQQVVEKRELDAFSQQVDHIRSDFDRLEARVEHLRQRALSAAESPKSPDNPFNPHP